MNPAPDQSSRLVEFQARLAARLESAQHAADFGNSRLGLEVAGRRWLIELTQTGEVVPVPVVHPVPLTQAWLRGLSNVRGNLYTVVDLSAFMGEGVTPLSKASRLVLLAPSLSFNAGILATRLVGLRKVDGLQELTPASGRPSWVGRAWKDADGHVWEELSLAQLVREESFCHVAAETGPA